MKECIWCGEEYHGHDSDAVESDFFCSSDCEEDSELESEDFEDARWD